MQAVKYSFNFRYQREIPREVIIPIEKLAGINLLDGDLNWKLRRLIDEDWELQDALLGDFVKEYEEMKSSQMDYSKDLEREREQAVIVLIED
ncbi:hypothetical protein [Arthrobacter sp. UYCo732]|uniref:hypothetical protein n=1 Tax=Arthrobacter sp. UYCo732 TaxID=3156336 RepID=UPI00339954C0